MEQPTRAAEHVSRRPFDISREGVKGASADFACFHCPLSFPQERTPCNIITYYNS
nr:MAG TPA: hypothetical protein [Caudoviricetes sp.]